MASANGVFHNLQTRRKVELSMDEPLEANASVTGYVIEMMT
jgi:hypothetical protein